MNYALGYTLSLKELFKSYDTKKLNLTASQCEEILGNRHKEDIMDRVMKSCINKVINDVINNNATFLLPTNKMCSYIKMKRVDGENFEKGRKKGKWKDVDFLKSNFTGNQMILKLQSQGVMREKPIYLDPEHKALITLYTNEGKLYF